MPLPDNNPAGQMLLSHDLRSAISRLSGAVHLLEAAKLEAKDAAHLAQVKASAVYIADLLDEAAGLPAVQGLTDLEAVFLQLGEIWSSEAARHGLEFCMDIAAELPKSLRMPQLDFIRIFNNLIGNSMKFSQHGAITLRAQHGLGGDLEIEVLDRGPGFSDTALAKLFNLRGRPDENRESGSGFGLYIARELVQKAGGWIEGENRKSGGAQIKIRFPEDLQMRPVAPAQADIKQNSDLPDLSHLKILLAEDNPTNQLVATQMLQRMKADVECADDGVEALERFENGDYNLGLIDIEMPRKSGLEVLRDIRARADNKAKTKLLALTAYVLPEHKERIRRAGADGIIAKPLTDIAAFGQAILNHTGSHAPASRPASDHTGSAGKIEISIYNDLKEIIGHDSMQELLEKVKNDLSSVQTGIEAGVQAKDSIPIRSQTHILISVAGAIGAVNLQHVAEALNAKARMENWGEITALAARCNSGLTTVLRFVEQELGR